MTSPLMLASASPRRRRLLALIGVEYDIGAVDVPEDIPEGALDPVTFASGLARDKALAARRELSGPTDVVAPRPILSADTIVVHEGRVLGKPADRDDARRMLEALSGGTHRVVTAVALLLADATEPLVTAVTSKVQMRALEPERVDVWLAGAEVLGCAGAYNIESHLASVAPTECFQNVAGLPVCHLYRLLAQHAPGLPGLVEPRAACERTLGITCRLGRELLP